VLAHSLRIDWRSGAEFFQWLLVDHDCAANWGNWRYFCGVGADVRSVRHYRSISQGVQYDPGADFVCQWVPELRQLRQRVIELLLDPDGQVFVEGFVSLSTTNSGSSQCEEEGQAPPAAAEQVRELAAQVVHALPLAMQALQSVTGPSAPELIMGNGYDDSNGEGVREQQGQTMPAWALHLGNILAKVQLPLSSSWKQPSVDPRTLITWQMRTAGPPPATSTTTSKSEPQQDCVV
jgi:hypothetical protein